MELERKEARASMSHSTTINEVKSETPMSRLVEFSLDMVAGGVAGCISKTIAAPIDRVKLLLQTQKVNPDVAKQYNGAFDCLKRVYREQGLISFWRGNVANLTRYFPSQSLTFAFKDRFRSIMKLETQTNKTIVVLGNFAASGAAGGGALALLYPLDMARTRLAADVGLNLESRRFKGTFHCLSSIYTENGVRGLYAGIGVSMIGVILFRSLFMGGYDVVKQFSGITPEHTPFWKKFLAAQGVTLTAGTLCYPLDTVRRRMMMQSKEASKLGEGAETVLVYRNTWHAFGRILREEGIRGVYSGLSANLIRGVSGAVLLVGYDEVKRILET